MIHPAVYTAEFYTCEGVYSRPARVGFVLNPSKHCTAIIRMTVAGLYGRVHDVVGHAVNVLVWHGAAWLISRSRLLCAFKLAAMEKTCCSR